MAVADVVVAYVNPPKGNSKKGTIKTETGEYYGVWGDKLHNYTKGGRYKVEYETENYQGKDYKTITKILGETKAVFGGGLGASGNRGMADTTHMFVTGVIGRSLQGSGGIPDEDTLTAWVIALRAAWERGFAAKLGPDEQSPPSRGDGLPLPNDEIPF